MILFFAAVGGEPAEAGGIGGSLSFAAGSSRLEDTDDVWSDLDTETGAVGLGLVFDTNLARDRLLNYRLATSVEFLNEEVGQAGLENEVQGARFNFDQTLGFGIVRTPDVRVFIGPSLHLGVGRVDDHIWVEGFRANYDRTSFTVGLGPELGVNFNVGPNLTFSTSAYLRYGLQVQRFHDFYDEAGSDGVFAGDEIRAGLVTSIFFRFDDDQYAYAERDDRSRRGRWSRRD
ncbi:MAG: hypothetical protein R3F35_02440 [Myxococcota bacterium]